MLLVFLLASTHSSRDLVLTSRRDMETPNDSATMIAGDVSELESVENYVAGVADRSRCPRDVETGLLR
jgi:hypothetical protein